MDLHYFRQRTNYDTFTTEHSDVVLYDDHRCILNVLYYLKKEKLTDQTPNVITFDYHDDALKPSPEQIEKIKK